METSNEIDNVQNPLTVAGPDRVLYANSPPGTDFGIVIDAEPSSLALLAAGVAGMAARRARRIERLKPRQSQETET